MCQGWLAGLMAPFEQDRWTGLVTSKLLLMSQPELIQMCGQDIHFTGFTFGHGFLSPSEEYHHPEQVSAVSGASFAIRSELWKRLGGFDPDLYMYYEETDLCWRARLAGFTCLYNPDSVAYHDYSFVGSPLTYLYSERNRLILLLKNWKWSTLILLLPSLLLAEIIDWGYMIMIGRKGLSAKVRAWIWLISNFSSVKQSRDKVQSTRKEPDWSLLKTCTFYLTPYLHRGRWMGGVIISICNLLFRLQYKSISSLLYGFNS